MERTIRGQTPRHLAIAHNQSRLVRLLKKYETLATFPQTEEKDVDLDIPPPDPFHGPNNMPALKDVPIEIMSEVA